MVDGQQQVILRQSSHRVKEIVRAHRNRDFDHRLAERAVKLPVALAHIPDRVRRLKLPDKQQRVIRVPPVERAIKVIVRQCNNFCIRLRGPYLLHMPHPAKQVDDIHVPLPHAQIHILARPPHHPQPRHDMMKHLRSDVRPVWQFTH